MKKLFPVILFFFCILPVLAQYSQPKEGDIYQHFSIDLNKDGNTEEIIIKIYKVDENMGAFGQIIVLNSSGKTIWAGPKNSDIGDPMTFGSWDFGSSLIEVAGDIDKDGSVEIICTKPVSDVRFTPYKLLRWKNNKFYPVCKGTVLVENPSGSGKYPWSNREGYKGRWISEFKSLNKDGTCTVKITEFTSDSQGKEGEAIVTGDSKGFHISKWVKNIK